MHYYEICKYKIASGREREMDELLHVCYDE